jgi:hypothetical protein
VTISRRATGVLFAALLSTATTGCIRKVLIDGQIDAALRGARAVDTLQDFEVAQATARTGLGTLEGLYKLAPNNQDVLYLLAKGWGGATFAFAEDEYDLAEEAKDETSMAYHRARMVAGFQRAKFFATRLLGSKASGFDAAQRNTQTMNKWLRDNFDSKKDAADLTVAASAFIGLVAAGSDDPVIVSDLYIGVAIAERALQLDETAEHAMAHVLLGGYHARFQYAELGEAKQHFDAAVRITEGKYLVAKFFYATRYFCMKSDQAGYVQMLKEVVSAGDPLPEMRLANLVAERRAARYLENKLFQEDCGFDG